MGLGAWADPSRCVRVGSRFPEDDDDFVFGAGKPLEIEWQIELPDALLKEVDQIRERPDVEVNAVTFVEQLLRGGRDLGLRHAIHERGPFRVQRLPIRRYPCWNVSARTAYPVTGRSMSNVNRLSGTAMYSMPPGFRTRAKFRSVSIGFSQCSRK